MRRGIFHRATFPCPVCGGDAKIRESETVTHLTRSLKYQCLTVECGHTWEAHLTFIRTLSPSAHGQVSQLGRLKRPPPDPLTRPLTTTQPPGEPNAA